MTSVVVIYLFGICKSLKYLFRRRKHNRLCCALQVGHQQSRSYPNEFQKDWRSFLQLRKTITILLHGIFICIKKA